MSAAIHYYLNAFFALPSQKEIVITDVIHVSVFREWISFAMLLYMTHILVAYDGLLFVIGISASLFIYLAGRQLRFLASFFWFFVLFTLNYFLSAILGYIGINLDNIPNLYVYLGSGISGAVNITALFFAVRSVHRFYNSRNSWMEIIVGVLLGIATVLMLLPLSVRYSEKENFLQFQFGYFLSSGFYLLVMVYIMGILIFNWNKLLRHPHRWFGFFILVFTVLGLVESMITFVSCLKMPTQEIDYFDRSFSLSSLPYLVFTVYMIGFCIKLIVPENREEYFNKLVKIYKISDREGSVIKLVLKGLDNQRIADSLSISLSTVKTHINKIFKKTGATSRFELARFFDGYTPPKV